jgi:hypothetical protein
MPTHGKGIALNSLNWALRKRGHHNIQGKYEQICSSLVNTYSLRNLSFSSVKILYSLNPLRNILVKLIKNKLIVHKSFQFIKVFPLRCSIIGKMAFKGPAT